LPATYISLKEENGKGEIEAYGLNKGSGKLIV
jgi:hypothetical protein